MTKFAGLMQQQPTALCALLGVGANSSTQLTHEREVHASLGGMERVRRQPQNLHMGIDHNAAQGGHACCDAPPRPKRHAHRH